MNQPNLLGLPPERRRSSSVFNPKEFKIQTLRECPTPVELQLCDTPDKAVAYWHLNVASNPYFDPDRECLVALLLNTRRRIKGHYLVSIGTMECILVSPSSVFRIGVIAAASALILVHNHPSGDPTPSDADIKVTMDLIRAGQLIKIEVLDHVIIGQTSGRTGQGFCLFARGRLLLHLINDRFNRGRQARTGRQNQIQHPQNVPCSKNDMA